MLLLLLSSSNFAIAIDAGDQLNQIERDQKRREPLRAAPIIEEDKPTPKPKVQGETFKVNNFLFEGNTLVSSDELKAFLKAYLNLEITLDELKSAVDSISIFYKDRGYLATATLPKQDITEGIVRIIITEAKFGGTELMLDPNIKYRIQPEIIQKFVEFNHPKGEILNLNRLGRAILIADELPGVAVPKRGRLTQFWTSIMKVLISQEYQQIIMVLAPQAMLATRPMHHFSALWERATGLMWLTFTLVE